MGQLRIERINHLLHSHPQVSTSLDRIPSGGEVQKRIRGKCYGVIFVCMVFRAVYVDVSQNYSSDALLQVLRRFTSVRG